MERSTPAILVYPDDPELPAALQKAAGGKLAVIRGWIFSGGVVMEKIAKVSGVKTEFYLRVTRSTEQAGPATIRLELARSDETQTLLMDVTLIHADKSTLTTEAAQVIAAILNAQ